MSQSPAPADRDLVSIGEARARAETAWQAQALLSELTQAQVDAVVEAMAAAAQREAEPLAALAVDETGYGVVADKVQKNRFAAERVAAFIRPIKTVGVIRTLDDRRVVEIAEPFGVVAAVIPSTNPTSTTIYKILIAIKARCAIVLSPHPAAVGCITKTADLMRRAGDAAGLPAGAVSWMETVTLEGTQELMRHRRVAVILATGGMGLVRAAYSAGKPAYGVGPGNAPAYIERTANVAKAVADIVTGKAFDHGVLCSSENSVVVDAVIADDVRREFETRGGYFLSPTESAALAQTLVTPELLPNPSLVGRSAREIAAAASLQVPSDTRVLMAPLDGVGRDYPLSIEKLCPVLSFYEVDDWRAGCERCKEILRFGGMGHTMSIHSQDDAVIREFGLKKPAFRIVVNTPTTHGSIGLTTGLDPAMTLGCGGYGGNITSDNISPRHLLNIKRLAYEIEPVEVSSRSEAAPAAPDRSASTIDAATLTDRIDAFLSARGLSAGGTASHRPTAAPAPVATAPEPPAPPPRPIEPTATLVPERKPAEEFVCEDDVRRALDEGRTLAIDDDTIVTPAARDLGERHRVFIAPDPR